MKEGRIQVTGRRGRMHKQLLGDLKEEIGQWKLKEEALDRALWRIRFRRGCGHVVRQIYIYIYIYFIYCNWVVTRWQWLFYM